MKWSGALLLLVLPSLPGGCVFTMGMVTSNKNRAGLTLTAPDAHPNVRTPMKRSKRSRVLAALNHEIPTAIPAYVNNVVDWEQYASYFNVDTLEELLERLGNSIVSYVPDAFFPAASSREDNVLLSAWGVPEALRGTYTDSVPRPLADAETVADVEAYAWPSVRDLDFTAMRKRLVNEEEHARMNGRWQPVFSRLCELFGIEKALMNMYANLPLIEAALENIEAYYDSYFGRLLDTCGDQLDIFAIGDDFACNSGLLISPDLWRRLYKPLYRKWLEMAKLRGMPTLMHCCGRIVEVLPDLIDIGLDAWETVQTHLPGQRNEDLKRTFGKHLTFVGGIDTTHVLGTQSAAAVRSHVIEQIRALGKNGGYICAPDHTIMAEVPPENVEALYETCRSFQEDGYTSQSG